MKQRQTVHPFDECFYLLIRWLQFCWRWLRYCWRWLRFCWRWLRFHWRWLRFCWRWLRFRWRWLRFCWRWLRFLTMMAIQIIICSFQKCGSLSGKRGTYKRDTNHIMKKREDIITCEDCCNDNDFCNIDGCGETGKYTYDLSTLTCSPVDICCIDIFLT